MQDRTLRNWHNTAALLHWSSHGHLRFKLVTRQQVYRPDWPKLQELASSIGSGPTIVRKGTFHSWCSSRHEKLLAAVPHRLNWNQRQLADCAHSTIRPIAKGNTNSWESPPRNCRFWNWCQSNGLLALTNFSADPPQLTGSPCSARRQDYPSASEESIWKSWWLASTRKGALTDDLARKTKYLQVKHSQNATE